MRKGAFTELLDVNGMLVCEGDRVTVHQNPQYLSDSNMVDHYDSVFTGVVQYENGTFWVISEDGQTRATLSNFFPGPNEDRSTRTYTRIEVLL